MKMIINVEHEVLVVYPHTDYCNSLLHGVPAVHLSKLHQRQNSAVQLINHTSRFCHILLVLHALFMHWLPVKFWICYKIFVISFKAVHNLGPAYLSNLINIRRCSHYNCWCNVRVCFCKSLLLSSDIFSETGHLPQLLHRYWTSYQTILGHRTILG